MSLTDEEEDVVVVAAVFLWGTKDEDLLSQVDIVVVEEEPMSLLFLDSLVFFVSLW